MILRFLGPLALSCYGTQQQSSTYLLLKWVQKSDQCCLVFLVMNCNLRHKNAFSNQASVFQQVLEDVRGVEEGEHGGRGDQPDVGGRAALHGSRPLPQHDHVSDFINLALT